MYLDCRLPTSALCRFGKTQTNVDVLTLFWIVRHCLSRHPCMLSGLFQFVGDKGSLDCTDEVVHIPSQTVLMDAYQATLSPHRAELLEPFAHGVNISWPLQCVVPAGAVNASDCFGSVRMSDGTCTATANPSSLSSSSSSSSMTCFRGVHDGVIPDEQVEGALALGASLIREGGDHFDVHFNASRLTDELPVVVDRLQALLSAQYGTPVLDPVAFRISVALPMDAADVRAEKSSYLLHKNINSTVRLIVCAVGVDSGGGGSCSSAL